MTTLLDGDTLPKITVFNKGQPQFEAYVTSYVVSEDKYRMVDGLPRHELYYLSMLAPRGGGTTLNAIFAALVTNSTVRDVSIDGLGAVALMHRSARIARTGYAPSWNSDFAEFGPDRALHALVESRAMTLWDPQQAARAARRSGGQKGKHREEQGGRAGRSKGRIVGANVSAPSGEVTEEVAKKLERHPIFLLLVPGAYRDDAAWVQLLHLAFIDKRSPWPLVDEWASFLWERAFEQGEIEQLRTWTYLPATVSSTHERSCEEDEARAESEEAGLPGDAREAQLASQPEGDRQQQYLPLLSAAYLCFPDLAKIGRALPEYIGRNAQCGAAPAQAGGEQETPPASQPDKVAAEVAA